MTWEGVGFCLVWIFAVAVIVAMWNLDAIVEAFAP